MISSRLRWTVLLAVTGCGRTPLDAHLESGQGSVAVQSRVCPPVIRPADGTPTIRAAAVLEDVAADAAGLVVTGLGERLVIGVEGVPTRDVLAFRTTDRSFEALALDGADPWCACGYSGTAVSVGSRLYTFANEGWSFDGRSWAPVPYPRAFRRGEAATAAHQQTVVMLGGRGRDGGTGEAISDTFSVFDPARATWTSLDAPSPFGPLRWGAAASLDERLFLISPGDPMAIAVWDGVDWTHRPPAPMFAARPRAVGYAGLVFVVERPSLIAFDPSVDAWTDPVPLPQGRDWGLAVAGCGLWLVARNEADLVVYEVDLSG